jgi:hypothetical protein
VGIRIGAGFTGQLRSLALRSGSLRATGGKAAGVGTGAWVFMHKRILLALLGKLAIEACLTHVGTERQTNPDVPDVMEGRQTVSKTLEEAKLDLLYKNRT